MVKRRKWIIKEKRPMATVTGGSPEKTIVYGVLSLDGKQLFRQDNRFDSQSFIDYLDQVKKRNSINLSCSWIEQLPIDQRQWKGTFKETAKR